MGWGNCGEDSNGRPIGYYHDGTCDYPECNAEIDRGLAHACGGMHGDGSYLGGSEEVEWQDWSCEGYFCGKHLRGAHLAHMVGKEYYTPTFCITCAENLERAYCEDEEWRDQWPTDAEPELIYLARTPPRTKAKAMNDKTNAPAQAAEGHTALPWKHHRTAIYAGAAPSTGIASGVNPEDAALIVERVNKVPAADAMCEALGSAYECLIYIFETSDDETTAKAAKAEADKLDKALTAYRGEA